VLAAEPGATIGLGLKAPTDAAVLRAAALDGSIIDMMIWHPCAPGDVFYTPAGTIHAIGAGVTLFEVQQNLDLTFRLFDYGRDRELHLDAALAVADLSGWAPPAALASPGPGRELLVEGQGFVLERLRLSGSGTLAGRPAWAAIIAGEARFGGQAARAGEVWYVDAPVQVSGDVVMLLAYPGAAAATDLWRDA
jgi:mannose-6-phosphate isomerase